MEKKKFDPATIEILKIVLEYIALVAIDVCCILLLTKGAALHLDTFVNAILIVIACFSTAMLGVLTVFYINKLRSERKEDNEEDDENE